MFPSEFFRWFAPRVLIVCALLGAAELLFRAGAWEPLVKPESNAGQAVRLKRAVEAFGADKINFVTLGDSRAVYGIEHRQVAATANAAGYNHSNLALAGMHWLSTMAAADWIIEQNPHIKGILIATNITNFSYIGNGAYELGIAAPFVRGWDIERFNQSVPFDRNDVGTYGVYSALFQYRDDIQNLFKEPIRRFKERAVYAGQGAAPLTFSVKVAANSCTVPLSSVQACAEYEPKSEDERTIVAQCKAQRPSAKGQLDWRDWATTGAPPHLANVVSVRQRELRRLAGGRKVMVVLMPVPKLWREQIAPKGVEEYVRAVLRPLADDGTIALHDFTHFFDETENGECAAFWDLYHQNTLGQDRLTNALLPLIQSDLYSKGSRK